VTRAAGTQKVPVLITRQMRLVAPTKRHAPDLFVYGARPEFTRFLDAEPFKKKVEAEYFVRSLQSDNRSGRRLYWVAELVSDGRAVGTLGLIFSSARHHRVAEFGYGFAPDTWGTGLFGEAARAVLTYGFETLRLHRVQAITRATNSRSIRGIEKVGFRREATLSEFYHGADGSREDAILLALFSSQRG
jgi:ribosomal-protein-alanine N-acetyltransferase